MDEPWKTDCHIYHATQTLNLQLKSYYNYNYNCLLTQLPCCAYFKSHLPCCAYFESTILILIVTYSLKQELYKNSYILLLAVPEQRLQHLVMTCIRDGQPNLYPTVLQVILNEVDKKKLYFSVVYIPIDFLMFPKLLLNLTFYEYSNCKFCRRFCRLNIMECTHVNTCAPNFLNG